jgi:predicted trehalose synthase
MVRSFHFAALSAVCALEPSYGTERWHRLAGWARVWRNRVAGRFVSAYVESLAGPGLLPRDQEIRQALFRSYVIERSFYELGFELTQRSTSLLIALIDFPMFPGPAATAGSVPGR